MTLLGCGDLKVDVICIYVTCRTISPLELRCTQKHMSWLNAHKLKIKPEKTEVLLLNYITKYEPVLDRVALPLKKQAC